MISPSPSSCSFLIVLCLQVVIISGGGGAGGVVQNEVSRVIVVNQNGKGDFRSIQEAIDSVPFRNEKWIEIQIEPGVYEEQVFIPRMKDHISIVGRGPAESIILEFNKGGCSNETCTTFTVFANNFVARNVTFQNTFNLGPNPNRKILQAPALYLKGDKAALYNCRLISVQDTLTDLTGRHYFESCYIQGLIDFIWGYGQSIYKNCHLNVSAVGLAHYPSNQTHGDRPIYYNGGYITAQGWRTVDHPTGFVFISCNITGTDPAFLGRSWRLYSTVLFYQSYFSDIIVAQGWKSWNAKGNERNITYAEVECHGPGAEDRSKRAWWSKDRLPEDELSYLTTPGLYIDREGWIDSQPKTAVSATVTERPLLIKGLHCGFPFLPCRCMWCRPYYG